MNPSTSSVVPPTGTAPATVCMAFAMSLRGVPVVDHDADAVTAGMVAASRSALRAFSSARTIVFRSWMSCRLTSPSRFSSIISRDTRTPSPRFTPTASFGTPR
jgi:hypothetical protein